MARDEIVLQDQATRLPKAKLYLLFLGLQTALLLSFIDSTSVSTILPIIGRDLDASSSIVWAGTAFLVANTSFQIITSRLSDIFGRKIVLLGSLAIFAFGDLLAGFAKNAVWLYCGRAVAGIGGGGINSLTMIIMSDVVTVRERGKYLTLLSIGIATGSAVGPFLGAVLAERARWAWAFWMIPPLSATTMVLVQFTVPQKPLAGGIKEKVESMDWLGSLLSLAMIVCILVPLSGGGSTFPWDGPVVIALFCVGGVAVLAFIYVEAKVARLPLFPGRLLKNRNICLLIVQTWFVGMVFYGGIYFTPLYLQNVRQHTPVISAAYLLPLVLTQVFTASASGYAIKYTNRTWSSFTTGFVLWLAGQGAQLCFDMTTSTGVLVGCLLLQGLGVGATIQSTLVLAQASGPPSDRAAVTGVRNFARTSGGAVGLALGNTILQNAFQKHLPADLPESLKQSLKLSFDIPSTVDAATATSIRQAYMTGLHDVFIYFVPVVGVCLVMCAFVKVGSICAQQLANAHVQDLPLDVKPAQKAKSEETPEEVVLGGEAESEKGEASSSQSSSPDGDIPLGPPPDGEGHRESEKSPV